MKFVLIINSYLRLSSIGVGSSEHLLQSLMYLAPKVLTQGACYECQVCFVEVFPCIGNF